MCEFRIVLNCVDEQIIPRISLIVQYHIFLFISLHYCCQKKERTERAALCDKAFGFTSGGGKFGLLRAKMLV